MQMEPLLVKDTSLNEAGLVRIKAEGAIRRVEVKDGKPIFVPGPSLHFTWWNAAKRPPVPGEWIVFDQGYSIKTTEEIADPDNLIP